MEEKLICIRKVVKDGVTDLDFQRIPKSEAEKLVATGDYTYTSKSKYRRYMASLEPKFKAGVYGSSIKDGKQMRTHNNRRRTRGRKLVYTNLNMRTVKKTIKGIIKTIKERSFRIIDKNYGIDLYESVEHLDHIDPITKAKVYRKEGKGKQIGMKHSLRAGDFILKQPRDRRTNITAQSKEELTPAKKNQTAKAKNRKRKDRIRLKKKGDK